MVAKDWKNYFETAYINISGTLSKLWNVRLFGTTDTGGVDEILTNGSGSIKVDQTFILSTGNSTATPLGIDGVFTGTVQQTNGAGIIYVSVFTDQPSAIDGLDIQQSVDGINFDHSDNYTIYANRSKNFSINPHSRYLRVIYTNGGVAQTTFRLQTTLKSFGKSSSHRIDDAIVVQDDAELVKAVITGKNPAGLFVNFKATTAGNFKVSLEEYENTFLTNPLPTVMSPKYITKIDTASATITYIGKANPGTLTSAASWQIQRIDTGTLAADILLADGNTNYDNVWDNRASLSYS